MARKLIYEVVLDSAAYTRQIKKVTAQTSGFSRDLEKVGRGTAAATLGFRGLGRAVGFASGWFLGGAGLAAGAKAAFGEMANAQKVSAQTAAVLKSTGGVAGITAKNVDALAASLMNLSGVDDEAIKSAENLLLTFTNIRGKAFASATKAALDMSVALGDDLQTSALQVGKALQDPIKGITSLRRAGVSFTQSQQTLIRTLVASGQTMDAQKLILKELTREFGGSAKAAGDTLPGQLNLLKQNVLNLGGAIATVLNPALTDLSKKANKAFEKQQAGGGGADAVGGGRPGDFTRGVKVAGDAVSHLGFLMGGAKGAAGSLAFGFVALGHVVNKLFTDPDTGRVVKFKSALDQLLPSVEKAKKPLVNLRTAGGINVPPGGRLTHIEMFGPNAAQRNTWFDQMVGRRELRAGLLTGAVAQLAAYRKIGVILTARIAATKDITRKLKLEDQGLQNAATVAGLQTQIAADLKQKQQDAAQKVKDQIAAARDEQLAWAQYGVAKAETTKSLKDNLAAAKVNLAVVIEQAGTGKRTAAEALAVLEAQTAVTDVTQQIADAAKARQQKALDAKKTALEAKKTAFQTRIDWAVFNLEKADSTKTIKDNISRQKAVIELLKEEIRLYGRTVDRARELFQNQQNLKTLLSQGKTKAAARKNPYGQQGYWVDNMFFATNVGGGGAGFSGSAAATMPARPFSGAGVNIGNLNLYGVQDVPTLENELVKRSMTRPQPRRGP